MESLESMEEIAATAHMIAKENAIENFIIGTVVKGEIVKIPWYFPVYLKTSFLQPCCYDIK